MRKQIHAAREHGCPVQLILRDTKSTGFGVFAGEELPEDAFIAEYIGEMGELDDVSQGES